MTASREEVLLAYRHLYKGVLRAVQYSMPARLVARERVRNAFRKSTAADYDAASIERTIEFLNGARRAKGLEHRIVKNLMHVWHEQRKLGMRTLVKKDAHLRSMAYTDFNATIRMLNESMGLCIE